ncbi:Sec63 Brl domain-containing protein [Dioszegia hungarica]|uniref:Sec63 Brl domain-containing protein n=1 Tax=Dioszegia hungarica TaxID=4972 RepID=A0AA38H6P9_9TREE|nr:Sec63 Brl domain-containing protein [Dioszegia hungarica]XP_052944786.1 Sec63 Brl domain-containing protein [Dioszegia hungarica]KAI9635000.1 Sec63 Brl domain-containing protein [Dioszegia hungarica]KAI9635009.1 Sec63 Brl domain-containing protein [Dioszegia hungarica]
MAPGISYDDSGSLASYFGVTFLVVTLVPATYLIFRPERKDTLKPLCTCSECQTSRAALQGQKQSIRTKRFSRRIVPLVLGWLAFAYLLYAIATAPTVPGQAIYDPFEILGLRSGTDEKGIKKHYKKLSLQYHPDKIQLGPNQTIEEVEGKFVELTKAYKSLTDEAIRENLAKYGNPDGPQQREDKIAIPQWVVEGKNSIWVLGAYGLVLGVGIPVVVGRWWFRQQRTTRDNILNTSAEYFFHNLREDTDFLNLITILAGALEFQTILGLATKAKGKGKPSKKERKEKTGRVEEVEALLDERREALGLGESITMRPENRVAVGSAAQRRARVLIWGHLLRWDFDERDFRDDQRAVLLAVQPLLTAISNISLAHGWLSTSLLSLRLQSALVQAIPAGSSPLAQLPGVSLDKAEELQWTKAAEGRRWIEKFAKADVADDVDLVEAKRVAEGWPRFEIVDAEFKVEGEKVVSPSSIVSLNFRVRYVAPSASKRKSISVPNGDVPAGSNGDVEKAVQAISDEEKDIEEGANTDLKEKVGDLKEKIADVVSDKTGKKDEKEKEKEWEKNGYAHAPFWPQLRKPHFSVLLGDSKLDKVIVPPIRITDIPTSPSSSPSTFSLTFPAPPQANLYSFVLHAVSDTFVGNDVVLPIMLKVEDVPEDDESDAGDADDISEPDEDSLAGQMALMKGGKVRPSAVHGSGGAEDGEDEEDGSEYESSSDEEGPRKGRAINEDSDSDDD